MQAKLDLQGQNKDDVIDVLHVARQLVSEPGAWKQKDYGSLEYDSCFCAVGALWAARDDILRPVFQASLVARKALRIAATNDEKAVETWNDEPGRTQDEVVDAFDRAIRLVQEA